MCAVNISLVLIQVQIRKGYFYRRDVRKLCREYANEQLQHLFKFPMALKLTLDCFD